MDGQSFFVSLPIYKKVIRSINAKCNFLHFQNDNNTIGIYVNGDVVLSKREIALINIEYNIPFDHSIGCIRINSERGSLKLFLNETVYELNKHTYYFYCGMVSRKSTGISFNDDDDELMDDVMNDSVSCKAKIKLIACPDGQVLLKQIMHNENQLHHDHHNESEDVIYRTNIKI